MREIWGDRMMGKGRERGEKERARTRGERTREGEDIKARGRVKERGRERGSKRVMKGES